GFVWISTQNANVFRADIYNTTIPFFGKKNSPDVAFGSSPGVGSFNEEGDSVLLLGTGKGLVLKDFRNLSADTFLYNPHNPNSISNDTVSAIIKDKQGNFWVATPNGLSYFNIKAKNFTRYFPDSINKPSISNFISALCEDGSSNLWIGTPGGGLFMLNHATNKFIHYKNSPAEVIPFLLANGNDLWIANDLNNGLNKLNLSTGK